MARSVLLLAAGLFAAGSLCAQTVPLSGEIRALEQKSSGSPEEKNRALRGLARLYELSGDMEGAAKAWNEAALAAPGRDYDAFLRCALCLAATGELENAAAAARAALLSRDEALRTRALYALAQIDAFRSGDTSALRSLLGETAFAPYKPGIYYTIWRISGDASFRAKLSAEFPHSPEALAVKDGSAVRAAPAALWFFGGLPPAVPVPAVSAPLGPEAPPPAAARLSESAERGGAPSMLQTGIFSSEENARALAGRLRNAGFAPVVAPKPVNGAAFWAVGVLPGADYNRTILLLKDAGFEAFPVY